MDPFVAEIRIFPFNFAPKGWAFCNGQLLPISQNTALFSLLGTTYGGDGKSTFALPDLQGSAPMHPGQGPGLSLHDLGETGGSDTVTLLESEIPAHSHATRFPRLSAVSNDDHRRSSPGRRLVASTCTHRRQLRLDGPGVADARRWQSAAQQPAAVPDVQLLHRAAGGVSAAGVSSRAGRGRQRRVGLRAGRRVGRVGLVGNCADFACELSALPAFPHLPFLPYAAHLPPAQPDYVNTASYVVPFASRLIGTRKISSAPSC